MLGNIWNKCENIVILRESIIISSIFNSFLKIYPIFQYPFSSETERNSTEKQNSFSLRKYFRINENMNSLRYNSARLYQIKFLSPNLTIWIKRSLIFHISTRKEKKDSLFSLILQRTAKSADWEDSWTNTCGMWASFSSVDRNWIERINLVS